MATPLLLLPGWEDRPVLDAPLSLSETTSNVAGLVRCSLEELLQAAEDRSGERFLNLLALKLAGTEHLGDITYRVVGLDPATPNALLIWVDGLVL